MKVAVTTGYSGTPLAKKLGIKPGSRVFVTGAPKGYRKLLEPLPVEVLFENKPGPEVDIAHVFVTKKQELSKLIAALRKQLRSDASLWVSWPKKAARVTSTVSEDIIRELALPLGFVDVKVCAIDAVWSGLKLVIRKELR
jgi:hypothetical protein